MIEEPELPTGAGGVREPGTDPVEPSAAKQLELSHAANAALGPPKMVSGTPVHDSFVCRRTERIDFVSTLTFFALVLGITAASGWRALVVQPTAPVAAIGVPVAPAPAPNAPSRVPVVQVINPFDASEVFELPGETTKSEARNAISDLLLQRARERLQRGLDLRRASNRHQPPPVVADNPPDVFSTRSSGPANGFAGMPSLRVP
jgi:hypothetical protein